MWHSFELARTVIDHVVPVRELVELTRGQGYAVDELVEMIEDV